jgi:uncharacterized protein (TIGR02646 family)
MIHLNRLPEPDILTQKKDEWTQKFIKSKKKRPDNSKYAHPKIKELLETISSNKCYYCERKLHGLKSQVDHYIEVSEKKELAFVWANLYLSCELCNEKFPNKVILCSETLNPFSETDEEITKHITFADEQIVATNNSALGRKTIQKYKLDSERHNYLRMLKLKEFHKILIQIQNQVIKEGRQQPNDKETKILKTYANSSSSYSLMFKNLLKTII